MISIKKYKKLKKYKQYTINAMPYIHPFVFNLLKKENKKSKILILGSGSGAFEARLYDAGFKRLTSVEYNEKLIKFPNSKKKKLDLNEKSYSKIKEKYDLIIGIEIIEHLYDPFNFLKNCNQLLNKKGKLIFSTPNIHSLPSRIMFLIKGYPYFFETKPEKYGHFSPIFDNHIKFLSKEAKYKKIQKKTCCNINKHKIIYNIQSIIKWIIISVPLFFINLINKESNNLISIYILKK